MRLPQAAAPSAPPPAGLGRFAHTGHALRVMERAAAALAQGEPVLLVGETGTGKTTTLSHLAQLVGPGRGTLQATRGCTCGAPACLGRSLLPTPRRPRPQPRPAPSQRFVRPAHAPTTRPALLAPCTPRTPRPRPRQTGSKLVSFNLSQQTDSSDLLGGFRPVGAQEGLLPLLAPFQELVRRTWTR